MGGYVFENGQNVCVFLSLEKTRKPCGHVLGTDKWKSENQF